MAVIKKVGTMKRLAGGVVALALLLAGCGSTATPAAQTVTKTATVSMTATTVAATATETTVQKATVAATTVSQIQVDQITVTKRTTETATPEVKTVTVTATRTVPADPVTVTATDTATQAQAAAPSTPSTVVDGTYLIGSEIAAGTYKCGRVDSSAGGAIWTISDSSGTPVGGGFTSVAYIPSTGNSADLTGCPGGWTRIS